MHEEVSHLPLGANDVPLPPQRAFVIQLRAQPDPGADLFIDRVEHMASGDAVRFSSAEDLIAFITRVLAPHEEAR
jgi:hypothetical protein